MTERFRTVELSDFAYEHEGLRVVTVKSPALGHRADLTVWAPQSQYLAGLLILLHGVWGSHWVWSLKGGVHRSAQRLIDAGEIAPFAIAMPSDGLSRDGSGYLNWPGSQNVEQWIVEEVPAATRLAVPSLTNQTPLAIGGLSMGGYGALRLGAKYFDRFCAISAHSAITDVDDLKEFVSEPLIEYINTAPRHELSALHWLRSAGNRLPELRFDCGIDDTLAESNRRLHTALTYEGIPHTYFENSGNHDWNYWQNHVVETLRFVDKQFRHQNQE